MSVSTATLQKALESAQQEGDTLAIEELKKMLGAADSANEGAREDVLSGQTAALSTPIEYEGALGAKQPAVDPDAPTRAAPGALPERDPIQVRERQISQTMYDNDMELKRNPENRPNRAQLKEFYKENTDWRFGHGEFDGMQRQVIVDPKTGKPRWTALSPEQMDTAAQQAKDRGTTIKATMGALGYGSVRPAANVLQNVDSDIEARNAFQRELVNSLLPPAEQERVKEALIDQYGKGHRYVKDPGLLPANELRELLDQNPENEKVFEEIAGDEWWEQRKEFYGRGVSKVLTSMRNAIPFLDEETYARPVNPLGADVPGGALTGRESYEDINYGERGAMAPAYPGASEDLRTFLSESKHTQGVYEGIIKPLLTNKGVMPGDRLMGVADNIIKKTYTEEQYQERQLPFFSEDVKIEKFTDIFNADLYTDPNTKLPWQNPEAFMLTFFESAPEMAVGMGVARGAGVLGARHGMKSALGQTISNMDKARMASAGTYGLLAGSGTEGYFAANAAEAQTKETMMEIPMERYREDSVFQGMVASGMTEESAKQVLAQEAATMAFTATFAGTVAVSGPMNRLIGKSAAGRLIGDQGALTRKAAGTLGEMGSEGLQGLSEQLAQEMAVATVDPENPIFDNPNRYLEAFGGEALVAGPFGAVATVEPNAPVGIPEADVEVARATTKYMQATNDRFKWQSKMADPDHIGNTTPNERLKELELLEVLQKAEAAALLEAEPIMRAHLEQQGTTVAKTELKMLGALKMRANAMLTDIAVGRAQRKTAGQIQQEEQRVVKDRMKLQKRVNESLLKLEDLERQAAAITTVQEHGAISSEQENELIKEGYAKRTQTDKVVVLPKGKRAVKELMRQARGLRGRLDAGYVGAERRATTNLVTREMIDNLGPEQREKVLYQDTLTGAQNRRAFNERQENIDVRKDQEPKVIEGAQPAVAAVDVDSLAWVNDNMSHSAGDRLLLAVADAISEEAGVEVFRLGGDEFAVTGASEEALETALQSAAKKLSEVEIASGEDAVTPQITWGKGQSYEAADAQAIDMKSDRVARNKIAGRKKQAATYRHTAQRGLFQQDGGVATSWRRAKNLVERGDSIEILTPDGAIQGVVTNVSRRHGKPRIRVSIGNRLFKFNPEQNHLIVDPTLNPSDLAWLTGDAEYAQPGRDTFPQVLKDVQIGHIGKDGVWYADLAKDIDVVTETPAPWWTETYPGLNFSPKVWMAPKLPEATQAEYDRAVAIADELTNGFANLPPINIVRSIEDLKRKAPHIVDQIRAEGGSLTGVRGYMDHINPNNGVYIFVPNIYGIVGSDAFEQGIAETLMHELIGHYGIRGTFRDEAELRPVMHAIVDAFPDLAKHYAAKLRLDPTKAGDKQLLGEEMVAYIAGEMKSGKVSMTPRQKTLWQRVMEMFRKALHKMGLNRWSPIRKVDAKLRKKTTTLHDSKVEFWTDARIQDLLARSQDFVRSGPKFEWTARYDAPTPYMRDGDIFQSGLLTATESATYKPTNNEKKTLVQQGKYKNKQEIPEELPLFPERASPNAYKQAIIKAQKDGWMTQRELDLSGFSEESDFYFFRDATYGTLERYLSQLTNDFTPPGWYKDILPAHLVRELDEINAAMEKNYIVGPLKPDHKGGYGEDTYYDFPARGVVNQATPEMMRTRIAEIMAMKIDPKKTQLTKQLLQAHLVSENVYQVYVEKHGRHKQLNYSEAVSHLFGPLSEAEIAALTEEQLALVKAEQENSKKGGPFIGYNKETNRWLDWAAHSTDYAEWSPQGSRFTNDFRVALIKSRGAGGEMGYSGHYDKNLMHLRTGVAELLEWDGMPELEFPNPAMQGKMLSLIELQSDWLQKLRKGFPSGEARDANEKLWREHQASLEMVGDQFGTGIASDIWSAISGLLTPIANLPSDARGDRRGTLFDAMTNFAREDTGQLWEDMTDEQRNAIWVRFTYQALDEVSRKFEDASSWLADWATNNLISKNDLAGSMDARSFENLDAYAVRRLTSILRNEMNGMAEFARVRLGRSNNQAELVEKLNTLKNNFGERLRKLASQGDYKDGLRLPMTAYKLRPLLEGFYEKIGANEGRVAELLSGLEVRESATVRVPTAALDDLNRAMQAQYGSAVSIMDEIISPSRVSRYSTFAPGSVIMRAREAGQEFTDVSVIGNKADVQAVSELVPKLVETWIKEHAADKLRINKANRSRSTEDSVQGDYEFDELEDAFGLEEEDTDEGSQTLRDANVTSFEDFEEEHFSDIHDENVSEAFNNMSEDDWDRAEGDPIDGVSRESDEYTDMLVMDEDGEIENEDEAQRFIDDNREEYRRDVLEDDDNIRDNSYTQVRDMWFENGVTAYIHGSFPISWDSDGDEVDYVSVEIIAKDPGDAYDIMIDGEEVNYEHDIDSAKSSLSDAIKEYYIANSITPPPGKLFGPEEAEGPAIPETQAEDAPSPNWDIVGGNIVDNMAMISDSSMKMSKVFEEFVKAEKLLNGKGVQTPSPLSKDEQWRPIALKYLIADAVRRGLGGVMWNNGLSSSTRGGMGQSGVKSTDVITWSKEKTTIRGAEQEVYVIRFAESSKPLVVADSRLIPVVGADVARMIRQQAMGKMPVPSMPGSEVTTDAETDANPRDGYIIADTNNDTRAIYRRRDNHFLGFASTDEVIDNIIQQDITHYGRSTPDSGAKIPPVGEPFGEVVSNGLIDSKLAGGKIFVMTGDMIGSRYLHTYGQPRLAGARQSYEDITVRIWNKELKKYGVSISQTYVKASNMQKAIIEESQPTLESPSLQERIKADHGSLYVSEVTGGMHHWVVMSEKNGPVINDVFSERDYAEQQLKNYIQNEYGSDREGVKVFYFPINEQMREEFSGPVAPFHYDPTEDPALQDAAKKFGYVKTPLRERYVAFKEAFGHEVAQGALDHFYGLKRALNSAEVDDGSYISARLTTSLDSMMKGVMEWGHPVWKDGIVSNEGRGLLSILQPILKDPSTWGMYMAGKRAKSLMLEGYNKLSATDKKLIDKAASHFDGDIVAMMAFAIEYDASLERDSGETAGRKKTRVDKANLAKWARDLDLLERAKKDEYFDRNGRRVPREWLEQEASELTEKLVGISRRAKPPKEEFVETIREHLRQAQMQLNPDPEISRLEALVKQVEFETSPHKKPLKRWAKRDNMIAALHAIDNLVQSGREHLFNAKEIKSMVALGDKFPQFERVAKDYAAFNKKMLDFGEASGIIDGETRPLWENADYVPFYRVDDERMAGTALSPTAGIANQRSPIRRLKGGKANMGDVVNNILMNVTKIVDASVKNNAALEAIDALRGSGIIANKPMDWSQELIPMKQIEKILRDKGVIVPDDKDGIHLSDIPAEALTGMQKMIAMQAPSGPGVVSVMRSGKREYYYTDDMLLYRAMTAINRKSFGRWIQMFSAPKRLLTNLITVDPSFMIANFLRDTGSAYVIGRDGGKPVVDAGAGFISALLNSESMRTMVSAGAAFENGYITGGDPNQTKKFLKRAMKSPGFVASVLDSPAKLIRAWKHIGSSIENANRVAVYDAAIAAGKSKKRAVYEAKDLMDFSMGGDNWVIRFLVQTVPFLNARAQGNYRLGRGMVENPKGFAMKGALVAMAGMALFLRFKDDERYGELQMWDKHAYFHFWVGDVHYRLPKPFEVGAIFNTIPEMMMEYYYSNETDDGKELLKGFGHMLAQTFNMSPIPQTLAPMREWKNNWNYFQKRPIVSYYEEGRMPPEQYRDRTSPTMIELARALPSGLDTASGKIRSPLHLQNFYLGYTGTIGRYMLQASDALVRRSLDYPLPPAWEAQDIPVAGRFVRGSNPPRNTKHQAEVYRMLDKVTAVQGSLTFLERTKQKERFREIRADNMQYIRIAKPLEDIREAVQNINRGIQHIQMHDKKDENGELVYSPKEKQKRIDALEEKRNRLFKRAYEMRPGAAQEALPVPVTDSEVLDMIEGFGVDDTATSQLFFEESAPDTYELLQLISNDLGEANLNSIVKANQ